MKKIKFYPLALLALTLTAGSGVFAEMNEPVLGAKDTANVLNRLVERTIDGQKGFQNAAEIIDSKSLKDRFEDKAKQHGKFSEELKSYVNSLGQDAANSGTIGGTVQRAWIDVKAAVQKKDDVSILEAVKNGEAEVLEAYRDALGENLPQEARKIVERQEDAIQSSYEWVFDNLQKAKSA